VTFTQALTAFRVTYPSVASTGKLASKPRECDLFDAVILAEEIKASGFEPQITEYRSGAWHPITLEQLNEKAGVL
jgi:hypothetical protein